MGLAVRQFIEACLEMWGKKCVSQVNGKLGNGIYCGGQVVRTLVFGTLFVALVVTAPFALGSQAKVSQKAAPSDKFQAYIKSLAVERGKFILPEGTSPEVWLPPFWGADTLNWGTDILYPAGVANERLVLSWDGMADIPKGKHPPYGALYGARMEKGKPVRLWYTKVEKLTQFQKKYGKLPNGTLARWLWYSGMKFPNKVSKTIRSAMEKVTPYAGFYTPPEAPLWSLYYVEESGKVQDSSSELGSGAAYNGLGLNDLSDGKPLPLTKPEIEYLKKKFMENQGK